MAKTKLPCAICHGELLKDEAQFVDETTFAFYQKAPPIEHGIYCPTCFDSLVRPELDVYNAKMERAKNVNIFSLAQSKESQFVRRIERPVTVEGCPDRQEAELRLAFHAVEVDKNSLVDVELSSEKIKIGGRWQSSVWSGRGIPVNIDEEILKRRFANNPN